VALGPKPRSYRQKTPKKMVQLALRSALSDRAATGRVAVVEGWTFEAPKTKDAVAALAALGVEGQVLVVVSHDDEVVSKSFRNLPEVQVLLASELNAYDVLVSDWIVFTPSTLPTSTSRPPDVDETGEERPVKSAGEGQAPEEPTSPAAPNGEGDDQ
jgi:large subunit ribosomal protein L4